MSPHLGLRRRWRERRSRRGERRLAGRRLVQAFAQAYPEAVFVEIGANDGDQHDHLRSAIQSSRWSGVMVEPVPYVFDRLRRNYGELARVALEPAAIAARDGEVSFWHLADAGPDERAGLPGWYDGLGSMSREQVLSHAADVPDLERRLVCTEVPALTFESLCAKHAIERLDLLVVDAEGFDWEILRAVDLEAHAPRLVVYEHFHLAPEDRAACRAHLERHGYETLEEGFDTFCLDTTPGDELSRVWRGLRPALRPLSVHDPAS